MKYYELKCTTYVKKDLDFQDSFDGLSKFINYAICQNEEFKNLHEQNRFKHYCFSSFYPIEKDGIYKQGRTYNFKLRALDKNFIETLSNSLRENINNPNMQVLSTEFKTIKQFFISELYSITPTITIVDNGDGVPKTWTIKNDGDIMRLTKQLHENLKKKYESFYNEELHPAQNFIQLLEVKNQKPQSIYFTKKQGETSKKIRLLGNKFNLHVNEDEVSQKLAFMALGSGLGEKQGYGAGFVAGKGLR